MTIYKLLNQESKKWWYYKQLRNQGLNQDARKKERESIRSKVKNLRHAWLLSIGDYGSTLYCHNENGGTFCKNWQVSGIDPDLYKKLCIMQKIPIVDKRNISFESKMQVIKTPGPEKNNLNEYLESMRKINGVEVKK